jgi:hypothetical protein
MERYGVAALRWSDDCNWRLGKLAQGAFAAEQEHLKENDQERRCVDRDWFSQPERRRHEKDAQRDVPGKTQPGKVDEPGNKKSNQTEQNADDFAFVHLPEGGGRPWERR